MRLTIDVAVEGEDWRVAAPGLEHLAERVVEACLAVANPHLSEGAELSVLFCDDAKIRTLNEAWRSQDKATNVLSFPAASLSQLPSARILGDVAVAFQTAQREARDEGKPFKDHVAHLLAHGLLHLLGFDHENDEDAERMEAIERDALGRLGVPDPYRAQDLEAR